jgi:hypothetical protein
LGGGDKTKTKTPPKKKKKKAKTLQVNKLRNANGQKQNKKAVGNAWDYSSTVNCNTNIPTIFHCIFGIFQ